MRVMWPTLPPGFGILVRSDPKLLHSQRGSTVYSRFVGTDHQLARAASHRDIKVPAIHQFWIQDHGDIRFETLEQQGTAHRPLGEWATDQSRLFANLHGGFVRRKTIL